MTSDRTGEKAGGAARDGDTRGEAIHPLILCGGSGTRLWPASRKARPKQFLPLIDGRSTYQETLLRVRRAGFGRPVVLTGSDHRFIAAEQAAEAGVEIDLLLEPEGRDSGPAFAAGAAHVAAREGQDAIMLALAADHLVRDADGFARTCADALPAAMRGHIVTFGIVPETPSPSYGYVVPNGPIAGDGSGSDDGTNESVASVERFVEKPEPEIAEKLIAEGALWNSGNFLTRADVLMAEYSARDEATVEAAMRAVKGAVRDLDFVRLDPLAFRDTKKRSIDYAVMEHTRLAAVVPARFDWSDVGGWNAMTGVFPLDGEGNAVDGDVLAVEASDCVVSTTGPMVAMVGTRNLAVVVTDDAVLVMDRTRDDLMRDAVAAVRERRPALTEEHRQSFRPWGNYRSLDIGTRHQVKRIVVKPGAILSLQHHFHRSEHWVVVRGTARVTIDERVETLHENQSVYIPIGSVHRMENPGRIDLEIIEVQTGSYLGEDDIVRHQDEYARQ